MKIIGEEHTNKRKLGELNYYKCSECGAEFTDIAGANACQVKHFDDRQKKRKLESKSLAGLDVPSIRTKPKITVGKNAAPLPPEDEDNIAVLITPDGGNNDAGIEENEENDLQGLADRLMEQYK